MEVIRRRVRPTMTWCEAIAIFNRITQLWEVLEGYRHTTLPSLTGVPIAKAEAAIRYVQCARHAECVVTVAELPAFYRRAILAAQS